MNPADLLGAMKRTVEQLAAFNEIAKALTSTLEVDQVLNLIGQKVSGLLGAERWSLLLEGDDGMLHFEICVGPGSDRLRTLTVLAGEGIAGTVFTSGKPRLVADVHQDPDFAPRFDEETRLHTRSALAVPLMSRERVLGVLELVNGDGAPLFTEDDLRAASAIADFAAIAIVNARNFKQVQELTQVDEHTNLFNARKLSSQLEAELKRCQRFGRPISLLFLDIDHFKNVNDTRGHLAGSKALKLVGELLSESTRGVDSAYRYGGDEFALLLLETSPTGALIAAQRILDAFRGRTFDVGGGEPIKLTVSLGAASFPDHAMSALGLLEAADRAMYKAKAAGRDSVMLGS